MDKYPQCTPGLQYVLTLPAHIFYFIKQKQPDCAEHQVPAAPTDNGSNNSLTAMWEEHKRTSLPAGA